MTPVVGTYDISTLLAARFTSANDFGLDTINQIIQADNAAHNATVNEMLREMAMDTTEVQTIYGSSVGGEMVEVDEYGRSATQKAQPGSTVGFPLRKWQFGLGWTRDYMLRATPADLAIRNQAAQKAHLVAIRKEIKRALYLSGNYTFTDYLTNGVTVAVKRLVNADSAAIPDGPDGSSFTASSHTHYDAINGLTAAALTAAISDVVEHGHGGLVKIAINFADEATVRALTGFVPAPDYRVIPTTASTFTQQTTNPSNMYNRYIGIFGPAEVWIKPWAIANYVFTWDASATGKPLAYRQDSVPALQGLRIAAELDNYPLYAQYSEAYFGFGVWTRTNGHSLYFGSGSYADPTIS